MLDGGYGRSPASVRRFSGFKWVIALILLLLIVWMGRGPAEMAPARPGTGTSTAPAAATGAAATGAAATGTASTGAASTAIGSGPAVEAASGAAGGPLTRLPAEASRAAAAAPTAGGAAAGGVTGSGPGPLTATLPGTGTVAANRPQASAAAAPAALEINVGAGGRLRIQGRVADDATRDQWLNAIRIGAQGAPVTDELAIGAAGNGSAAWSGRLSGLVALLKDRRVAALRIDADRVQLRGTADSAAERAETERLFQAQLPTGFRVDNQIRVGPSGPGVAAGSVGSAPGSTSGSAAAPTPGPTAGSSPSGPTASPSGASPTPGRRGADTTEAPPVPRVRPANCPRSVAGLAGPVFFKTDASDIGSADRARLQRLGQCLAAQARLRVVGHADPRHTDEYNKELSERRARAVAAEIAAGGTPMSRIAIVGAGKLQPAGRSNNAAALQRSRRVDIQIR